MLPVWEGKGAGHQRRQSKKSNDAGSDPSPNGRYSQVVQRVTELEPRESCHRSKRHETGVEHKWMRRGAGTELTGDLPETIKSRIEKTPHGDGAKIEQGTGDSHPSKHPLAALTT